MAGEQTVRERIAALESWRVEHRDLHNRDHSDTQANISRRVIITIAIIQLLAVVGAAVLSSVLTYLLTD